MFAQERRRRLLHGLRRDGSLRVTDAAAALGVSPMTVRRDLTALAQEGVLHRVHGGAIAAPLSQSGPRIAIMVPDQEYYYRDVVIGAEQEAARLGCQLVIAAHFYDVALELSRLETLSTLPLDALVLTTTGHEPDVEVRTFERLADWPCPVVLIERRPPQRAAATMPFHSVCTDHREGSRLAVAHLQRLGHSRALAALADTATGRELREEIPSAAREGGLALRIAPIGTGADSIASACRRDGIRAVLVHSDLDAAQLLDALGGAGFAVPEDVHLISFDDVTAAESQVPLTAIAPARKALGAEAVHLAQRAVEGSLTVVTRILIPPRLIIRASAPQPSRGMGAMEY